MIEQETNHPPIYEHNKNQSIADKERSVKPQVTGISNNEEGLRIALAGLSPYFLESFQEGMSLF